MKLTKEKAQIIVKAAGQKISNDRSVTVVRPRGLIAADLGEIRRGIWRER